MPIILAQFGTYEWTSYFYMALVLAIFASVMYFLCFRMVKEHVVPDDTEKFSLVLALRNIFTNQPLLCVQISNIFCLGGMVLRGYLLYYYCQYNLGNVGADGPIKCHRYGWYGCRCNSVYPLSKYIGKRTACLASPYLCSNKHRSVLHWLG